MDNKQDKRIRARKHDATYNDPGQAARNRRLGNLNTRRKSKDREEHDAAWDEYMREAGRQE